jgi:hypothetical protein
MRALTAVPFLLLAGFLVGCTTTDGDTGQRAANQAQCAGFGYEEGTDAFADCMMTLSLRQQDRQPPDRDTLIRRYRDLSMARRGDDRYPVCDASGMENELDIVTGGWVGPNCQMAQN